MQDQADEIQTDAQVADESTKVLAVGRGHPTPISSSSSSLFKSAASTAEALATALTILPDPDQILQKLGISRYELKCKLESDDEIYGALETRRDAAISTPWRLEPRDDTPEEPKEFIWMVLEHHIEDILSATWNALPCGYSVIDMVYLKHEDGRIGISSAQELPMQWFKPKPDGSLVNAFGDHSQALDTDFKYILTRRKATFTNPYGEALLSRLYWPFFFRNNSWRFWMRFLERFGDPLLLGKAQSPKELSEALLTMGLESHVIVGTEEEMSAVTQGRAGEFEKAETALVKRIQKLILGQTLTSDVQGGGSYAAAQVHNEVREDRRNADLRMMTKSVQRIIDALWALNRFSGSSPLFVMEDGLGVEPERAERDAQLVSSGAIKLTEQYFMRTYDFEEGDFEIPSGESPDDDNEDGDKEMRSRASFLLAGRKGKFTARQEEVEDHIAQVLKDVPDDGPIPPALILNAIRAARDPDDLADRLGALLGEADVSEYQGIMERALYAADVLGYVQEDKGKPAQRLEAEPAPSNTKEDAVMDGILKQLEKLSDDAGN